MVRVKPRGGGAWRPSRPSLSKPSADVDVNSASSVNADVQRAEPEPLSLAGRRLLLDQIHVVAYFMVFVVRVLWSLINREHSPPASVRSGLSTAPQWLAVGPERLFTAGRSGPRTSVSLLAPLLHTHGLSAACAGRVVVCFWPCLRCLSELSADGQAGGGAKCCCGALLPPLFS